MTLIWAGNARQAETWAHEQGIPLRDVRLVFSSDDLRGHHGATLIRMGTFWRVSAPWEIEWMAKHLNITIVTLTDDRERALYYETVAMHQRLTDCQQRLDHVKKVVS